MPSQELREIAWERMLTSQANVIYYQRRVHLWTCIDAAVRMLAAIAASATVVAFISKWAPWIATTLSLVAALGSTVSLVLKVPDKMGALSVLLVEYVGHQNAFERLYQFGCTQVELERALDAFAETEKREAKDHPKPDDDDMAESQELVRKRLGVEAA